MKKYLKELPNKSHSHRRRFALAVSSGVTLLILVIWLTVKFGGTEIAKDTSGPVNLASVSASEPDTVGDILTGLRGSWQSIRSVINGR